MSKFKIGDVVQIKKGGFGLLDEDEGNYIEVVGFADYYNECDGIIIKPYNNELATDEPGDRKTGAVGIDSFGENPIILLNTLAAQKSATNREYSLKHYDTFYHLTDKDIESGKIKIDAYFVAKQWKVGSKDDSGALFHNLKTIARFGEKNSVEREIKALYNQTIALARIYNVDLESK